MLTNIRSYELKGSDFHQKDTVALSVPAGFAYDILKIKTFAAKLRRIRH